ncbi:hypothetical protein LSTR_LSTR006397 [Laodelphax striatellus]|uniref:Uncharacterized protein n=1 Tax=Laodelphax striatellus TaxID=195883 RepID=A0A482WWY2_LAOST|nr:hypothetical protein LSTR_LSTR006397 [Laodelphax striatellus]
MEVKNNTKVAYKLQEVILPEISTFELDLTDGFKAMVRVLCPPGMEKMEIPINTERLFLIYFLNYADQRMSHRNH